MLILRYSICFLKSLFLFYVYECLAAFIFEHHVHAVPKDPNPGPVLGRVLLTSESLFQPQLLVFNRGAISVTDWPLSSGICLTLLSSNPHCSNYRHVPLFLVLLWVCESPSQLLIIIQQAFYWLSDLSNSFLLMSFLILIFKGLFDSFIARY